MIIDLIKAQHYKFSNKNRYKNISKNISEEITLQKSRQWIGIIILMLLLSSCSNVKESLSNTSNDSSKDKSQISEKVSKQALSYLEAIENKDYEKAYGMLSDVYSNSGVSVQDFTDDFQNSELNLSDYNITVLSVRDRLPDEISKTNKGEPYYLANLYFDPKGETREEFTPSMKSDVKWVDDGLWFHKENGEWKLFATDAIQGVTWKPDAYQAVLKYMEALQNDEVDSLRSDYYIEPTGMTEGVVEINYLIQAVKMSYEVDEITDELDLDPSSNLLPEVQRDLLRVNLSFQETDTNGYPVIAENKDSELFFHFENGEWKLLTENHYDFYYYDINCRLGENCKESFADQQTTQTVDNDESDSNTVSNSDTINEQPEELSEQDFMFEGITVKMPIEEAVSVLADSYNFSEDEGYYTYTYDGYSLNQTDYNAYSITVTDEKYETNRGIRVGSSMNDVIQQYGQEYEELSREDGDFIIYNNDGQNIRFKYTDDTVSEIAYY